MVDLPTRELGRTGLPVTMLGYSAMELRGAPRDRDVSEAQAETILNAELDAGINYIDTSIDYGFSEERIGGYTGSSRQQMRLPGRRAGGAAQRAQPAHIRCLISNVPAKRGSSACRGRFRICRI